MAKKTKSPPHPGGLVRRLRRLTTEAVSDVLDVMGLPNQVLAATIRAAAPGMRLGGPAFCVRGRAVDPDHPAPAGIGFEVDRRLTPGCVVVTASGGFSGSAVIGGNTALAYKKRGCSGLLVDGAVRDFGEMRALGLAVFATHVTPRRQVGRWSVVEFGQTVALPAQGGGEVVIHPGDIVFGDADGVVAIPRAIAGEVIAAAEKLARIDAKLAADLKRGRDREAALKRHDRYGHIRKLVPPG